MRPYVPSRALVPALLLLAVTTSRVSAQEREGPTPPGARWPVHSMDRPKPPVVNPGPDGPPAAPPSDAIVLFNGRDLSAWTMAEDSSPAKWLVRGGYFQIVPQSGGLRTRQSFGSVQLHIEWSAPNPPRGTGQDRGNSGVYLMSNYEVQVLDSYHNDTYADGQAASLYGQTPPLANAMRAPGHWNTYDIVFHRPRFNSDGSVAQPGRVTVIHNGVLVQDNVALWGQTVHMAIGTYKAHADRLPLMLQDHGHPVRYRNVWLRELPD